MSSRPPFPRIPVTILTGFLGSGKTTLLNRALSQPSMARTLVIINEFGEIGLDHALVARSDDTIIVLDNGCLCCTVFGDLIDTLNRLYHRREAGEIDRFEHVIIETSGLAEPTTLIQAFLSDPTLEGLYTLGAVVCVVDAVNVSTSLRDHDVATRQIAVADRIVVTKLDLVEVAARPSAQLTAERQIRMLSPGASLSTCELSGTQAAGVLVAAAPDPGKSREQAMLWLGIAAEARPALQHHEHLNVATLSFTRDRPLPPLALQLLLDGIERNLGSGLLRIKAIVTVEGEDAGPAVVQGAQHLLHNTTWLDHWPFEDRISRFVIIAAGLESTALSEMIGLLDRIATRTAAARARAPTPETPSGQRVIS